VEPQTNDSNDKGGPPRDEADRFTSILRSEEIYGRDFQSPGGRITVAAVCRRAQMHPGMAILDIGSGLGGASFYLAEKHGASVVGIDISPTMIEISTRRAAQRKLRDVCFRLGDIRTTPLERNTFDLAWSRESILYIAEKDRVWRNVHASLKPGGQLVVTDFCRGKAPTSSAFERHVSQCQYHLQEIARYAASLRAAGFEPTAVEDITPSLIALLRIEQESFRKRREDFCARYGRPDFDYMLDRWDKKIAFCEGGHLKWGLFVAVKRA
jgi:phosphoethanolamine N-methyltransferase